MTETYLNGKITVTSLATPTVHDLEKICALSQEDRQALLDEALALGRSGPLGNKTVDEIWDSALRKAKAIKENRQHAL